MRVTVLYFGIVRERFARDEEAYELAPGSNVRDLIKSIEARHGDPAQGVARVRFAVNNEYVDTDRELFEDDEVAVIPPVSGGIHVSYRRA